jgi:hypothetical protein
MNRPVMHAIPHSAPHGRYPLFQSFAALQDIAKITDYTGDDVEAVANLKLLGELNHLFKETKS